jgi:PII-like signaling protein
MARLRGSKNKNSGEVPVYMAMSTQERVLVLANMIVDRVMEDQATGGAVLKRIEGGYEPSPS